MPAAADYAAMMMRRRRFSKEPFGALSRIVAILSVLLGLTMNAGPAHTVPADEASLTATTQNICATHRGGHERESSGCCCLQATARRDATVFVAILLGVVHFACPEAPSFAARSTTASRAGVALPTTPWLSRAPPLFS
ncbi:hypothetical protein FM996_20085 [Methylosinus sporium]|uniref:Uncharacterized protein n=1 Tax=Methylosinus sporium TaxID=428 RepID=A0A549SDB5_METSR|nr:MULTISPECIES: hypothetical protein [Methylosinus]MBU3889617.1 hypothetical protein [Methylosinus sp. KRF6]TRL25506.1 hypothetical protein FM996_20085 [Methylosinus sporium]